MDDAGCISKKGWRVLVATENVDKVCSCVNMVDNYASRSVVLA